MNSFLQQLESPPWWYLSSPWGNGHTVETDPTQRGWRIKALKAISPETVLIGQRGIPGCAICTPPWEGEAHGNVFVQILQETPNEVSRLASKSGFEAIAHLTDPATDMEPEEKSGWGLAVVRAIEQERRERGGA